MTMRTNSIAMLLICFLHSLAVTSAFMARTGPVGGPMMTNRDYRHMGSRISETSLRYKDVEDNDYSLDPIAITATTSPLFEESSNISVDHLPDLPRSYVKKMTDLGEFPSDTMSEAEMLIGRVCMIASLWLIGNEVFTGVGFADQITNWIGKL